MEHNENMEWETIVPAFDHSAEMKKIRRSLRKRNFFTICTCLVLVITLTIGTLQYGIPILEKQYWNPNSCTYLEDITDLQLTMVTYNELFSQGQQLMSVEARKTGFAQYDLDFSFIDWKTLHSFTDVSNRTASLDRGKLSFSTEFWHGGPVGYPFRVRNHKEYIIRDLNSRYRKLLNQYPGYVEILADITFSEDLTMEQLLDLTEHYDGTDALAIWANIRVNDPSDDYIPECGIHLYNYNGFRNDLYDSHYWADTAYPELFYSNYLVSGETLEQHFTSMLKFSNDQLAKGTGVVAPNGDENFYQNVLDYVDENGVKAYGCTIIATPKVLNDLMNLDVVYCVTFSDVWIGF